MPAEFKIFKVDAQQNHATRLATPFPIIAAEQQISPVSPPVFTKTVKNLRVQRLHRGILLNRVGIEGDIAQERDGLLLRGGRGVQN